MDTLAHVRVIAVVVAALLGTLQPASDSFEVVVIHPNRGNTSNTQMDLSRPGQFIATNATARTLLRNAYGLLPFQLEGSPKWDDEDGFDIQAKLGSPDTITPDRLRPLLQSLLAQRFHLRVHWESRPSAIYILVRDKDASRVRAHQVSGGSGMDTRKTATSVLMKGSGVRMDELATNLANQLGRYVINRTELDGNYDFLLNWSTEQNPDTDLPSLFTAIREQMGLRLQPTKGPMPMLVVDAMEKPSDN